MRLVVSIRLSLVPVLFVALFAHGQDVASVPENLRPPAGESLLQRAHATGDQVYLCNGTAWTLSRPDARLFDDSGKPIGSHFAGPAWEYSDGSRVTGKAIANATPDPASIPWLLVQATDHQGDGLFARVSSIQRISTRGGKAPDKVCSAKNKGEQARSHYTADYLFFGKP
jgi:hypothetical protein